MARKDYHIIYLNLVLKMNVKNWIKVSRFSVIDIMHGKEGNEWLDRASHLCIIMSINCYSRLFEQQLLLFFSIAAMLTCSMTRYWLVYVHLDSNNLPFQQFLCIYFVQRTRKFNFNIIKLFLFSGECSDFKNACNNCDADQYITSTGLRMLSFCQIKPNISF